MIHFILHLGKKALEFSAKKKGQTLKLLINGEAILMPVTRDWPQTNRADAKNAEGKITSCWRGCGAPGALLTSSHALRVGGIRLLFLILEMVRIMTPNSCGCSVDCVRSYMEGIWSSNKDINKDLPINKDSIIVFILQRRNFRLKSSK